MATRFRAGQRLKPHSFCILYGTAEAVPYKDLVVAKQLFSLSGLIFLDQKATGFRACVAIRFRAGQRLKPHSFCILYGTAEAVPYKDLVDATQA